MSDGEWKWEEAIAMKCVCGHEQKNEDEEKNKFIYLNEKFHTEEDYRTQSHTIWACPKCGTLKIDR